MRHSIAKRAAKQLACATFRKVVSPKGDFLLRFVVPIEIHTYLRSLQSLHVHLCCTHIAIDEAKSRAARAATK